MSHSLQITRFGGPDALKWVEVPSASLPPDQVRIRVSAAGVNFADIMMRMGLYPEAPKPPFTPGYEIAGEVIEIGSNVRSGSIHLGDRVLAGTRFGGYTDEIVLPVSQVRKIPDRLSYEEAACIPVNFLTAWVGLQEMGRVRKGDRVLIQSAAGGVGVAAVQIAAQAGATVVGLVGSSSKSDKAAFVKSLGASEVMTYDEWNHLNDSDGGGFQVILDSMGGATLKQSYRRLAPAGRVITFGMSNVVSGNKRSLAKLISVFYHTAIFTPFQLMMKNKGVYGLNMLQFFDPADLEKTKLLFHSLDQIMERFQDRSFRAIVGKTFPFTEGGAAQTYLQSRSNIGKVVLTSFN